MERNVQQKYLYKEGAIEMEGWKRNERYKSYFCSFLCHWFGQVRLMSVQQHHYCLHWSLGTACRRMGKEVKGEECMLWKRMNIKKKRRCWRSMFNKMQKTFLELPTSYKRRWFDVFFLQKKRSKRKVRVVPHTSSPSPSSFTCSFVIALLSSYFSHN